MNINMTENCYDRLVELNDDIRQTYEHLNALQSALDRKVSALYHDLERSAEFTVAEGDGYARRLKETLQYRRVIKDELCKLAPLYNTLKGSLPVIDEQYNRAIRKSYEIKTSLNSTLGIEEVLAALEV